jgi:hypothetical protein
MSDADQPVEGDAAGRGRRPPLGDGPVPGRGIIRASVVGTALFTALALGAVLVDSLVPPYVIVSLSMFAVGSVLFVVAFFRAVDRSRTESIGIGGLFFGAGTTPGRVQAALMGSLAVQVVVALVAAGVRPYTAVAFGTLAPMWALGWAGLWVAAHGVFPERVPEPTRSARRDADRAAHRRAGAEGRSPSADDAPADGGPGADGGEASEAGGAPG